MKNYSLNTIIIILLLTILLGGFFQYSSLFGGKVYLQIAMNFHLVREKLYPRIPLDHAPTSNIFILAGQSNMVGRGGVSYRLHWDGIIPAECSQDPRILRLNADNELEPAKEPLHDGLDRKVCGVSPGMAFANRVLEVEPEFGTIVLVPCAVGGSRIETWSAWNSSNRERLVVRTKEAVRLGGRIRAILWYQGESDTEHIYDAKQKFPVETKRFIRRLYRDLNFPSVPFIQVALGSGQGDPGLLDIVRANQFAMEDVITVDAMGFTLLGAHLTTDSQVRLGRMLADAYLKNRNGSFGIKPFSEED